MVDARPSDAIALALRFEIPIFVDEKVMTEGSVMLDSTLPQSDEEKGSSTKSQLEILQDQLQQAVIEERYEEAARIRDEIKKFNENN
jgi:bifunctional DNase/RNase